MRIEKARREQLPEILDIYERARGFMAENGNPSQWGGGYPARELLKRDLERGELYLCLEGEKIAAVFMFFVGEEPSYREIFEGGWKNERPYGTLHRIASSGIVKGAAGFCIRWCQEQCRERGVDMRGDTHRDNLPMQRALEKNGFERCGIIYVEDKSSRIAYQYRTGEQDRS